MPNSSPSSGQVSLQFARHAHQRGVEAEPRLGADHHQVERVRQAQFHLVLALLDQVLDEHVRARKNRGPPRRARRSIRMLVRDRQDVGAVGVDQHHDRGEHERHREPREQVADHHLVRAHPGLGQQHARVVACCERSRLSRVTDLAHQARPATSAAGRARGSSATWRRLSLRCATICIAALERVGAAQRLEHGEQRDQHRERRPARRSSHRR